MFLLILVFESAKVNGLYKFPGGDQVSDYIQLPQKLLSKAKCKYLYENIVGKIQNVFWFRPLFCFTKPQCRCTMDALNYHPFLH